MRDIVLSLIILSALPFITISPFLGVLVFNWLSLMSPHRLTFGFASEAPWAMMVGVLTIGAWAVSRESKRFPTSLVSVLVLVWMMWITITTASAIAPGLSLFKWSDTMKTLLVTCLVMMMTDSRERITAMVWVIAASIGFYGFKGGIWWILHAGQGTVGGPEYTQMADNNQLALALDMALPLIFYLYHILRHRLLRLGALGTGFLNLIAIIGTYSRGGMIALVAVGSFLVWKSRHRFMFVLAGTLLFLVAAPLIPTQWVARMTTVQTYDEDGSANLRFEWWGMARRIAADRPITGGGFSVFLNPSVYPRYFPDADHPRDVHSIYFEVLGEHGYVGLMIFVALLGGSFLTASKTIFMTRRRPELRWAADLARMLQVSLIGYAIAGAFLTMATSPEYYCVVAVTVALERYVRKAVQAAKSGRPIAAEELTGRWDFLRPPVTVRRPASVRPPPLAPARPSGAAVR